MTIRQWAEKYLDERGMREAQVHEIIERLIVSPKCEPLVGHWERETKLYPDSVLVNLMVSIDDEVLKYMDEKDLEAWNRSLFL